MTAFSPEPWNHIPKIVIGIDLGSTYSGVSYAHLVTGGQQCVSRVMDWPGQEGRQICKIPTVIYYNKYNEPVKFGTEAVAPAADDEAFEEGWTLVKHFKLCLHPASMREKLNLPIDSGLPPGLSLEQVYRHFFEYLLKHTRRSFEERVLDGPFVWKGLFSTADIVIAHPNGWDVKEQQFLRKAAVDAGLVSDQDKISRVTFVTEGEASLHYCMFHADLAPKLRLGTQFVVCDAGGSTIDMTSYVVTGSKPFHVEETKPSGCIQAGGIFVDSVAGSYIQGVLSPYVGTQLDEELFMELVKTGKQDFESNLKRSFRKSIQDGYISVPGCPTISTHIRRGRIRLDGVTIEKFFKPFVDQILDSLHDQIDDDDVRYILLVGGFGESQYLREQLDAEFPISRCQIITVNDSTSKAVSDGAVIWCATTSVLARACRFSFGHPDHLLYNPEDPNHLVRGAQVLPDGSARVKGAFDTLAVRGTVFRPEQVVKRRFCAAVSSPGDLTHLYSSMYAFMPAEPPPRWFQNPSGELEPGFEFLCKITSDLSPLLGALKRHKKGRGKKATVFYALEYAMCLKVGGTELMAYIEWTEKGVIKRSEAQVIANALE